MASVVGSYTFKHGWGDCGAGCQLTRYWDFTVTEGVVQLVNEYGSPTGACCLADDECALAFLQECEDVWGLGGTYHGGDCEPTSCTSTGVQGSEERVNWGEVKNRYR
jgi:hypothetical protein